MIYWEFNHPNCLSFSFRGVESINQPVLLKRMKGSLTFHMFKSMRSTALFWWSFGLHACAIAHLYVHVYIHVASPELLIYSDSSLSSRSTSCWFGTWILLRPSVENFRIEIEYIRFFRRVAGVATIPPPGVPRVFPLRNGELCTSRRVVRSIPWWCSTFLLSLCKTARMTRRRKTTCGPHSTNQKENWNGGTWEGERNKMTLNHGQANRLPWIAINNNR